MKPLLALFLTALCASAADRPVTFAFKWVPQTNQMAGLSTNDYLTNITFRLYATTNVATPIDNWPMVVSIPAQPLLSQGPCGTDWTYSVTADTTSRFYVMRTYSSTSLEGEKLSPFSNTCLLLSSPPGGQLSIIR